MNCLLHAAHSAGLYKQLSVLRDLIADVREDPGTVHNLKEAFTQPECLLTLFRHAGLYKQLSILRDLIADVREDPGTVHNLKEAIAGNVESSGLQADCPLREGAEMSAEAAAAVGDEVGGCAGWFGFVDGCCVC